jgi:hypothetical protein
MWRSFCQLIPILAYVATRGCDVFHQKEKVQKTPKHDFWTYWSISGESMSKNHYVTRAANFCQLIPILAYNATCGCDVFHRIKNFKKHKNINFGHIGVYWVVRGKKSLRDSRGKLLSINANIGLYWHTWLRCFSQK